MKKRILPVLALMAVIAGSCSKEDKIETPVAAPEVTITAPAGGFTIANRKWINIRPEVKNDNQATYLWMMGADTLATTKDLQYVFETAGNYTVAFTATNSSGAVQKEVTINVTAGTYENKVTRVFEYFPAPGQFVHTLPVWTTGDNDSAMAAKAETALKSGSMIHLGGFGGYVVMGFDHTIINKPGESSFIVKGNAFTNWSEPGIILVSSDVNGNGLPDDEWYEIAGSEYNSAKTVKNYQITYYKPDENKVKTPNKNYSYLVDTTYIRWKDNQGQSGYLSKNSFHAQSYYPQWKGDSITFTGTKLTEENVKDLSGSGTNYVSPAFEFGYADNWANGEKANIQISWAVDQNGKPVQLKGVDFIKVYTGIRAEGGWLGEISTEVTGVEDLNLK